jgi:dynein heavy chain
MEFPDSKNVAKRLEAFKDNFTSLLYDKICLSLFEKDKIVFSLLLMIKINMITMTPEQKAQYIKECRLLVTGGSGKEFPMTNPTAGEETTWLSNSAWNAICEISQSSPTFTNLDKSFQEKTNEWKNALTSNSPMQDKFPEPFQALEFFHKIST